MSEQVKQLADAAAVIAARGATEYLRRHNLKASNQALSECLQSWIKIQLPVALADAKEAFECNMTQVGVSTFTATMINAGIEAAKECGMPIPETHNVQLLN